MSEHDVTAAERSVPEGLVTEAVVIRGVSKQYGAVVALDDINIDIPEASIHGLVGPNGCGKTTLLNVMNALVRPDQGSVQLLGVETHRMKPYAVAQIGVARTFQTPRVFNELSVWEQVQVGMDTTAPTAPGEFWLFEQLEKVKDSWSKSDVSALPHGSQRLLEIIRVVARAPRLLLMDEPAAGLSADEREGLGILCRRLRDELGMTIVVVEHDLGLIWRLADQISVMDQGRIVESGTPRELKGRATVENLFTGETDA